MKRFTAIALTLATLPGCGIMVSAPPTTGYVAPKVDARLLRPVYETDGASLADANHAVRQYMAQFAPDAKLLEVHATMVGTNSRVARTSAWEFIFEVPVAQPVVDPVPVRKQPVSEPVPVATSVPEVQSGTAGGPTVNALAIAPSSGGPSTQLKLVYTGQGQLLAPRYGDAFSRNQPIDFSKTILLDEAIKTALDIGMGVADPGLEIYLTATPAGRTVYSIDSSYAERTVMDMRSKGSITWSQTFTQTRDRFSDRRTGYSGSTSDPSGGDSEYCAIPYGDDGVYGSDYPSSTSRFDQGAPGGVVYKPVPQPRPIYVRGKYLIDALSGDIIQRPSRL